MIAIYARQSVDKKDSISIETQIDFCKREAEPNAEISIYKDKGFSGKNTDRPEFIKLLSDVENGTVTKIIVYKLDRISRSITDFASIMELLTEHNVGFVSSTEKFDTATPAGRAMLYIVMVFAQLERETIAERIRDNYYARGETGVWLGGPAPFGFSKTKKNINGKSVSALQNNNDIELVKYIYDEYARTDTSLGGIAKKIRGDRPDEMWNNIKLSRILHNPVYVKADADVYMFYKSKKCIIINPIEEFVGIKGCSIYGKRDRGKNKYRNLDEHVLSLALHDGVIDSQTWLKCQQKLDKNRQLKNTGKGKHTWLTGLVKCAGCKHSMVVKCSSSGKKYLNCSGKYSQNCGANHKTHYLEDIENAVFFEMYNYVKKFKTAKIKTKSADEVETNQLKIELHKVEAQIENLVDGLAQGNGISIAYINNKIADLDKEKTQILTKLNSVAIKPEKVILPDLSNWPDMSTGEKRIAAASILDKIYLSNDGIKIEWKY